MFYTQKNLCDLWRWYISWTFLNCEASHVSEFSFYLIDFLVDTLPFPGHVMIYSANNDNFALFFPIFISYTYVIILLWIRSLSLSYFQQILINGNVMGILTWLRSLLTWGCGWPLIWDLFLVMTRKYSFILILLRFYFKK